MKKFLSLVLALVMTMSLVTVSAGAKDFSDNSKIAYKEAVDVMSAVKVIDGYTDGSFNPSATLTRGAAAKIICNLILGPTTASALVADAAPYKDVPTNHTFAGYIAYCQKEGIISGYADGTFKPANTLTGYAFMKMLLGALGYKAENEGYTGPNWSIQVAKRAINVGLNDDLNGSFNGVKAVTREEACLYAFNTLKATMVEYDKNSTITVGNITIKDTSDAKEKTCVKGSGNDGNIGTKDGKVQFAEEYFSDLKGKPTTDEFERPATQWKVKSTDVGTYSKTPDLTYTEDVKVGTIYSDLGLSNSIAGTDITVYVDGAVSDPTTSGTQAYKVRNGIVKGDVKNKLGGNGVLTEVFYDDDADTVIVTEINTYIGEIAAAYKASAVKDAYVTLKSGSTNTGDGTSYETDDTYAVDSKVLYTYSYKAGENCVESMQAAESVTGTLTAYSVEKDVTVGGTKYKSNDVSASKNTINTSLTNAVKTDVVVYLDSYGYAIYVDADAASDNYAAVLGYDGATGGAGTLLNPKNADLLFMDGTRKTVKVKGSFGDAGIVVGDVVSYRLNSDGEYELTEVASGDNSTLTAPGTLVTKGTTQMANKTYNKGTSGASVANGKTVFLFWNEGNDSIDRYEGIANTSTFTKNHADTTVAVLVESGAAAAKLVFVSYHNTDVLDGAKKDTLFIKGGSSKVKYDADRNSYYEYDAILNGEITKVKTGTQITNWTLADNYTKDSKDVVTLINNYYVDNSGSHNSADSNKLHYAACTTSAQNDAVVNGTVTLAGVARSVADDVKVFTVDANGDIAAATINAVQLDSNDKVWYKLNSDGEVEFLVVEVVDVPSQNPGTPSTTYTATLKLNAAKDGLEVAIAGGAAGDNTTTWSVEKVIVTNLTGGVSAEVTSSTTGTLTAGAQASTPVADVAVTTNGLTTYQVVLKVGNDTVTSNKVVA